MTMDQELSQSDDEPEPADRVEQTGWPGRHQTTEDQELEVCMQVLCVYANACFYIYFYFFFVLHPAS